MWRRKHNPRRADNCGLLLPRLVMPLVSVSPFASLLGPSCLLASYAPAAVFVGSSSHPLAFPSAACFLLIGSSARPLPRIARLPAPFDKRDGAARSAGAHRRAGGGCLLASDGGGRMAANGWRRLLACLGRQWAAGGHRRRMAAGGGVASCLPRVEGRSGSIVPRSFLFPSHRLIQSTRPRLLSSSHRLIDGEEPSFHFRPTPSRRLFSACLLGACSPVPGRGM